MRIKKEQYFQSLFYIILKFLGAEVEAEIPTPIGRIDATLQTPQTLFVIEFKINKSPQKALQQIKEKRYYEPYVIKGKKVILTGINFDTTQDPVGIEWKIETL